MEIYVPLDKRTFKSRIDSSLGFEADWTDGASGIVTIATVGSDTVFDFLGVSGKT